LIHAARLAHDGSREARVDFTRVMADVHAAIARVYAFETPEALAKRGVEVAIGNVRFQDDETVEVAGRRIRGEHFVVCTGAAPHIPQIPGLESVMYLTYETVFDLDRLPASMIVIGAGATGVEIAQALARLGCKITLIDQRPSVLTEADPDAAAIIHRSLQSDGIDVQLSAVVNGVTPSGAQVVVATSTSRLTADAFLLATGRRPRIGALDLERAHIDLHDGSIRVDKHLRTTNPHAYAAGDVTGGFQFTHYAGWQGYVAARNALLPGTQEGLRQNIPWVVFTDPEVAQAGLSEVEARAQFSDVKVHRLELERVDRAQTADEREGFLKLITGAGGKLVGATVVSVAAGETVNELALAIDRGLTLSDLASTIHAYPTFGFAVQQLAAEATFEAAASGIRGQAIRALRRLT
jgi:pyruvate/2-oxoglutarate dehydrogenase complex dihydrolipoamide dehydrogenase (E3) component